MTPISVIDNGYCLTNVFQKGKGLYSFPSRLEEKHTAIKQDNIHILEIDGKTYSVGEGAERYTVDLNKTNNNLHRLLTITGLGLITPIETYKYKIVANYPLNLYNKKNKKIFENYLKTNDDYIKFKINGRQKIICIEDCLVFPQTLPVLYVNDTKSDVIGILDVGGLTVQGVICKNKNIIYSTIFTESKGMLVLQQKIKKELNSKYNTNIQDYQIEDVIKSGLLRDKLGSQKLINEICYQHTEEIIRLIKLVGWNEDLPILLTGGGSLILYDYFKKFIPDVTLSNDPLYDNVKGLWDVARVYYDEY